VDDLEELASAASAALGTTLSEPVRLVSGGRSAVLRCRSAAGGTVVVKSYPGTEEGAEGFTAEAAGLRFTTGTGLGPDLLAADPKRRLVVMTDLGDEPSLADALLGSSAPAAKRALLDWVAATGELACRTAGQQAELTRAQATIRTAVGLNPPGEHWLAGRIRRIPRLLAELALPVPGGLAADLTEVAALLEADRYPVFSPGDICPDNNLLTAGGLRFIDFESAEFHSAFLDAAYLRMPFSSCWCVFRLPADLTDTALRSYRDAVCDLYPELARDVVWLPGLRRAMAAWTLHATNYLLDRSLVSDRSMNPEAAAAPTARQLLRYRWQVLGSALDEAADLPAISVLMSELLTGTESWDIEPLPLYPALR
jgi:hypothetical protein